jgi:L-tartrate/succinate antiporter
VNHEHRSLIWRWSLPILLGSLIAVSPTPDGLTVGAWRYLAVFVAVIVALVTEPIPGAVVGLVGVTIAAILRLVAPAPGDSIRWVLTGFADSTVWLMFVVLMFALGYEKTGLGRRIALTLVRSLGGRTLGLGYAVALADLALAPLTPSNTARSGGIVFPIIQGIPALYGSLPGETARTMGAYLMWTTFAAMCVTSSMFVTALAPNLLAQSMLRDIAHVNVTWTDWFLGFLPVGLVLFGSVPLLVYVIYPPTVKSSEEVPRWAGRELAALGRIKRTEILMALLVSLALGLWIFGGDWVHPTTAALLVLCLMMLVGIIDWNDVLGERRAWNTLTWFATLVTLADGLNRVGFLGWFATRTVAMPRRALRDRADRLDRHRVLRHPLHVREPHRAHDGPAAGVRGRRGGKSPAARHAPFAPALLHARFDGGPHPVRHRGSAHLLRERLYRSWGVLEARSDFWRRVPHGAPRSRDSVPENVRAVAVGRGACSDRAGRASDPFQEVTDGAVHRERDRRHRSACHHRGLRGGARRTAHRRSGRLAGP